MQKELCTTRNLPSCLHVKKGQEKHAFSLCSTHKYIHSCSSVPSMGKCVFMQFSCHYPVPTWDPPSSLHPATRPEPNTCGAIPQHQGAAPSPSPGFLSCQLTRWNLPKLAKSDTKIIKNKPESLWTIPNILQGHSVVFTISLLLRALTHCLP